MTVIVRIYCHGHHGTSRTNLCRECEDLLQYSLTQIDKCPFGAEKGACSQCRVHCYKGDMRERIREVMSYAGPKMFTRNPILAVNHILKKWKQAKKRKAESGK